MTFSVNNEQTTANIKLALVAAIDRIESLKAELSALERRNEELVKALNWAKDGFKIHAPQCTAYIERIDAALHE